MSEQSHVNSLFLHEDAAKRLHADSRVQRLRQAVQKRAARAKKRMRSITAGGAKSFFRRNAFVLFTIAAVLLGMELVATPGVIYKYGKIFVCFTKILFHHSNLTEEVKLISWQLKVLSTWVLLCARSRDPTENVYVGGSPCWSFLAAETVYDRKSLMVQLNQF